MDDDRRRALRLIMGGRVATSDGGSTSGLSLGTKDTSRFFLGPVVDLPPRPVSQTAGRIAAAFAAEGFTLTAESLPGVPGPRQWTQRPAAQGIMVGERGVARDPDYDRVTRWVSGALALLWVVLVLGTVALDRGEWIPAVFLGAFFFGLPAYAVSSYRGRGYTGLVVVAELSASSPSALDGGGPDPAVALHVRIGAGYVRSHESVGRNLGQRNVRSVESSAEARAASSATYRRFSPVEGAGASGPPGRPDALV